MKFKVILATLVLFAFVACGQKEEGKKGPKVGLVLSIGGLGDGSFNDSAYEGLTRAKEELGIDFSYVEPNTPAEIEDYIRDYAENGYDLVITIGFYMVDPLEKVAKDYKDVKFAIVDGLVEGDNVASLNFSEKEGSFLAGVLAGLETKSNKVGFIGGLEIPLIKRFEEGFEMGSKYINPEVEVYNAYVGGGSPFADPVRGKEIALSQNSNGVDIIFHASGASGMGIFEGAKERSYYAIGVDSNQDSLAPGYILSSMLKRIDIVTFEFVKDFLDGDFVKGERVYGIKEGGVALSDMRYTKDKIDEETFVNLDQVRGMIINGEISF